MGLIELRFDETSGSQYKVEIKSGAINQPRSTINKELPLFAFEYHNAFQQNYQQLCDVKMRIALKSKEVHNTADLEKISEQQRVLAENLRQEFLTWLQPISAEIQRQLKNLTGDLQVRIPTECVELRNLPWHLWNVLPKGTEVVFTDINAELLDRPHRDRIRILLILGDSTGIDVTADKQAIEQYCGSDAEVVFRKAPQREELIELLADRQGWDILFFSGHSETDKTGSGRIYINKKDSLKMEELEESLKPAIKRRLQMAIFNSCDGLGITRVLEKHNIAQVVVMKEPIPDRVAQDFLKAFLQAFTKGARFDRAVNMARESLKKLEADYPCASWLPVIIQNRHADSPTWQSLGKIRSPYKGLAAFTEQDAEYFYGREDFVAQLAEQVARQPLVAVIGASGSGKSSVVQAGLLPLLRRQQNCDWQIMTMRLGKNPFEALAKVLLENTTLETTTIKELALVLEIDRAVFTHHIVKISDRQRILLFIDQFEELFTQSIDRQYCQKFLQALAHAVNNAKKFTLLFTLRSDFLKTTQQNNDFQQLLGKYSLQHLEDMTLTQIKIGIIQPAAKLGMKFEKGLVDRLLSDLVTDNSNLSLIQFVLNQLWKEQQPCLLTHQGYGKILGASENINQFLANYAEEVYTEFLQKGKEHRFKQVFLDLLNPGENSENTEHTIRVSTRTEIGENNWLDIVKILADKRLVVTNWNDQTQEETVKIIHKASIKYWHRLQKWINEYPLEIEAAARQYNYDKSKHKLWQGKKLAESKAFQKNKDRILSLRAKKFIQASSQYQLINQLKPWGIGGLAILLLTYPNIQKKIEVERNILIVKSSNTNECPKDTIAELIKLQYKFKNIDNSSFYKKLSCTNFSGADFSGANLKDVNFKDVNLSNVNLIDANLRGANLRGANLSGAYLSGADFEDANLGGANLLDADFSDIKNLSTQMIKTAKNWEQATYSEELGLTHRTKKLY